MVIDQTPAQPVPEWAADEAPLGAVLSKVDRIVLGLGLDPDDQVALGELLYSVALEAFEAGIAQAPAVIRSGSSVAEDLGLSGQRVRQLAASLGVGSKLRVGTQDVWVFTPMEVQAMAERGDRRRKAAAS